MEQFESKNLLSAGVAGLDTAAAISVQPIQLIVPLSGGFQGKFVDVDKIPDVGASFTFSGSGRVHKIGSVALSGSAHTLGFIIRIHPVHGTFVLTGAHGSVTVQLTALEHRTGATGLPVRYSYKIVGGTGNYTNAVDHGTAKLTTVFSTGSGGPFGVQHGSFKLVLRSAF
jgi:hypothetical protein